MKKTKYFAWLIAAGMAMSGCSDEMDGPGTGTTPIDGESGYIKVALNLPTTSGPTTRAENGDFDDGIDSEYKVNNISFLIFQGATEQSAVFKAAVSVSENLDIDEILQNSNITSYVSLTPVKIPKPANNENTYVLAIVNHCDLFIIDADGSFTIGTEKWTSASNKTVESLYTTLLTKKNSTTNVAAADISSSDSNKGFLMLNAPYASHPSVGKDETWPDGFTVTTLPEVHVYETESQAEGQEPDNIYVERAVAKVTVSVSSNDGSLTVTGDYYMGDNVTIENWALQTTNKSTYFVRNVSSYNTWQTLYTNITYGSASIRENRFFGTDSEGRPYRVYWAIDPNYSKDYTEDNPVTKDFTVWTPTDEDEDEDADKIDWKGLANGRDEKTNIAYCLENTFDAAHMEQNQTTGVIFKARYTPKGFGAGDSFFMMGGTSKIYTVEDFIAKVNEILGLSGEYAFTRNSLKEGEDGGRYILATGQNDPKDISNLLEGLDATMKQTLMNDYEVNGEIKYYKDGAVFYYSTQIQHFGDYYTPIDDQGNQFVNSVDDYNDYYHLGRYGVVRNNWYEINVAAVNGPGEPEIPEEPEYPDDPKEAWIKCNINVLSWAVRKQEVTLK